MTPRPQWRSKGRGVWRLGRGVITTGLFQVDLKLYSYCVPRDAGRCSESRRAFLREGTLRDRPFVPQADIVGSRGFFLQAFCLLAGFFDGAHHVEGLLREVVPLAVEDLAEAADGVFDGDVAALAAGEDLGDEHRLREEALDAAGPGDGELVLFGELFRAEDGDDVLEVSVALEDGLHASGGVVVVLADEPRVEDAREGSKRVDGGGEGLLDKGALQGDDRVEMTERRRDARVGVVVGGHVDRLKGGDRTALGGGDALLKGAHVRRERRLVADG